MVTTGSSATAGVIRLYWVNLLSTDATEKRYRAILNEEERSRADRFVNALHRRRWEKCRAQLRLTLAEYCGVPATELVFSAAKNGKPVLSAGTLLMESGQGRRITAVPHFNLSHSGDYAVIAISDAGPVGIDVEYLKRLNDWDAVAQRFFSAREKAELATQHGTARQRAFYRIWTRKEALIKATGEGLAAQLDSFDVTSRPGVPPRICGSRNASYTSSLWTLHDIRMGSHYIGAVATQPGAIVTDETPQD